jgi:ABC-2 type transport system ATP-binding protein
MAERICQAFGRPLPEKDGKVLVELDGGATEVAGVVRALDEAGILVESLELVEPTLDDVFVAKTGEHITADDSSASRPGSSGRAGSSETSDTGEEAAIEV